MSAESRDSERSRLDEVSGWYTATGFEGRMVRDSARHIAAQVQGRSVLEVGGAEGYVTQELSKVAERVVVVEAAEEYADRIRARRLPNVDVVVGLIEDFESSERFDCAVLAHLLEHVASPREVIERTVALLEPSSTVLIAVPNAGSIHRRIGRLIGALDDIHDLTPADIRIGHRRVYDEDSLRQEISAAGLELLDLSGLFAKPLANSQMDSLPLEVQEAFLALADELPPSFASELFARCSIRSN